MTDIAIFSNTTRSHCVDGVDTIDMTNCRDLHFTRRSCPIETVHHMSVRERTGQIGSETVTLARAG